MNLVLSQTEIDVLKALAFIIDMEEGIKLWHSSRVAAIACYLAERVCPESGSTLYVAGLLHDVGALDIPNRKVHMDAHFEDRDVPGVKAHPQKGAAIIASLDGFMQIAKIVLDHHEWFDGTGYPRGLKGDEISLESQILRIADKAAFQIDTNPKLKKSVFLENLKLRAGKEFSESLFNELVKVFNDDDAWNIITNEKELEQIAEERFSQIPRRKEDDKLAIRNVIRFFSEVLDVKHPYTEGHSRRVAYFSRLIALALGLPAEEVEKIELAAYFHDIGKLGIPKQILDKKEALTPEEYQIIKNHAEYSHRITKDIAVFQNLANIVGADQEHWDGSGYPSGLKKEEIPLEARIIFVADAFDAMTSNRSYRKAMPVSEALKELKRCAGKDFDPKIVEVACQILEGFENSSLLASYAE